MPCMAARWNATSDRRTLCARLSGLCPMASDGDHRPNPADELEEVWESVCWLLGVFGAPPLVLSLTGYPRPYAEG